MSKSTITTITILTTLLVGGLVYLGLTNKAEKPISLEDVTRVATEKKEKSGKAKKARIKESIELEILKTKDPATGEVPSERLVDAERFMLQKMNSSSRTSIPGVSWTERGPDNVGGRTRAILFDANDPTYKKVWAGGASGGLWFTNDITASPVSWTKVDDFFGNLAVSAIVQHPSTPSEMYFATGEGFSGAVQGKGIWKSTDAGATWIAMGGTSATFPKITELVVTSTGALIASVEPYYCNGTPGGVWRLPAAGTWAKVHNGSGGSSAGCAGAGNWKGASDIVIAANGDIYAGLGPNHDDGIYRSTDDGVTWTKIFTSNTNEERIEIAIAPNDSDYMYALIEADDGTISRIIKSTNITTGTPTFTSLPLPSWCDQGTIKTDFTRGQAFYDLAIAVDPNNRDNVFIGGIDLLKSTNGGSTWSQLTQWAGNTFCGASIATNVHADHHNLTFQPGSSSVLINGSDGGINYTTNANAAQPTFITKNNGYNITQYYACAMHPTNVNYFLAGAQDNGSQKYTSPGMNSTTAASGGDGAYCHIDQDNGNNQITSYVYSSYYISTNGGTSFPNVNLGTNKGKFINPTDLDDTNNNFYASDDSGFYGVTTNVFSGARQYTAIAHGIGGKVSAVKVDQASSNNTVWFGIDGANLIKVTDANNNASKVITDYSSSPGMPSSGNIQSIDVDPTNSNHIIFCLSNYGVNSVYESIDGGASWTASGGNLPDMPVRWVMFNPGNTDQAYIATELGVWSTQDLAGAATDWDPTNTGLANVRVDMLQHRTSDNMLAAATHGRGLYTAPITNGVVYATFNGASTAVPEAHVLDGCNSYKTVNIPVNISFTEDVTLSIAVDVASTATNSTDYTLQTSSLSFTNGGTTSQNVELRIVDDGISETDETVVLTLSVVSGAQLGAITTHTVTISDDDLDPMTAPAPVSGQIGTGATAGTAYVFLSQFQDARTQMFFLASELTAQGFSAGEITELSYFVYEKNSTAPYNNYTVKMKNTSTSSSGTLETGATTAYTGTLTTVVNQWNTITMTTPFYWDGTSNLMVETCFDNTTTSPNNDNVDATATASSMSHTLVSNSGSGCSLSGTIGNTSTNRANTRFKIGSVTNIESVVNKSKMANVGTGETVHFYSDAGDVMATITHVSGVAPGCVTVTVDEAGNGNPTYANLNNINASQKNFTITATNPTSTYDLTLYYTDAELAIWGADKMALDILKSSSNNGISDPSATTTNTTLHAPVSVTPFGPNNHIAYKGQFTSFSSFALSNADPVQLPIELLSFTAKKKNDKEVLLEWESATEINFDRYEIEKSEKGVDYVRIGEVSSDERGKYTFTDSNPFIGNNYYRLKMLDLDGSFKYSNIEIVRFGSKVRLVLLPNPSPNGEISFDLQGMQNSSDINITVTNAAGQLVKSIDLTDIEGDVKYDAKITETPGIYFVRITLDNGQVFVEKLVVGTGQF